MKQLKLSFLLCLITIVTFAQTAQRGEQNPPAPGIGIVIKKNPGGGASKVVVTNENGQANITIKEAGNYTIALTQTQGKTAGEPLMGIVVKFGCNVCPKKMTVTTNEKGEAQLKDLEKGDYTFTVEQPVAEHRGHVTLIKKNEGKPNTNMTISDDNTSTDYVGHVTLLRFSQLYLGGGLIMPSSTTKEGANSVNGIDFNIGYYQPIWAWEKSMISLGINAELGYNLGNGERDTKNQYTVYNLAGQSQLPTVQERGAGSPKNAGFRGAAGLQLNVHLGDKFTLSPIINAGYLSTTHKSFSVTETVYYNGSEYNYDLLSQKESKTSGLGILPKLRMTYNITPRIGIWLEGNYTMGPKIKTETTRFVLDPSIPSDSYNLGHFEEGQYITTKKETSYSAVGVNGGIVFSLGKSSKSDYVGHVTLIKKNGSTNSRLISSTDCDGYWNGTDCSGSSGICCLKEIIVTPKFDLLSFDKLVSNNNYNEIQNLLKSDLKLIGLENILKLESGQKIIDEIVSGNLVLEKIKSNSQKNSYLLKNVASKKHNYVGHVTLLK